MSQCRINRRNQDCKSAFLHYVRASPTTRGQQGHPYRHCEYLGCNPTGVKEKSCRYPQNLPKRYRLSGPTDRAVRHHHSVRCDCHVRQPYRNRTGAWLSPRFLIFLSLPVSSISGGQSILTIYNANREMRNDSAISIKKRPNRQIA